MVEVEAAGTMQPGLQRLEVGASRKCPVKEGPQDSFWQEHPPPPPTHTTGHWGSGRAWSSLLQP